MRQRLTRKRSVWLSIGAAVVVLLVLGFVAGPAHDVHTAGAMPLRTSLVDTDIYVYQAMQPSQSIGDVRCQVWAAVKRMTPCPTDVARTYLASVTQTPNSLYMLWQGCISWHGSGAIIKWQGYNVEYLPSDRTLVIHCFVSEPWITRHPTLYGVVAMPRVSLLVVPTGTMGPGAIRIVEDDRIEHLLSDQSDEFQLATVTIS